MPLCLIHNRYYTNNIGCKPCRCKEYHIVHNITIWRKNIPNKFQYRLSSGLIEAVAELSSRVVELDMRNKFEKDFDIVCDHRHAYWKKQLISVIKKYNFKPYLNYFWNNILYTVITYKYSKNKKYHLDKYISKYIKKYKVIYYKYDLININKSLYKY